MDKRLIYDPKVDLSNYNTYQEPMNNVPSGGYSSNLQPQQMNYSNQLPQISQMQQPLPPQAIPQQYIQPNYSIEKMSKSDNNKKLKLKNLCSMSTLRKILVITILYVIISHNRVSLLLCNHVPYVCITNALSYNVLKGIILSIIITLFYNIM